MSAAQHLLDQLQSISRIEAFAPELYASHLADELPVVETITDLEACDARLRDALTAIDAAIERIARIRIDHALADDTSLPPATRKMFATTVLSYEGRWELLAGRAQDAAARGGSIYPADVAYRLTEAARAAIALRGSLRDAVLDVIRTRSAAALPVAAAHARDRRLEEAVRKRWSAARRDLEILADDPARISAAPMPARLASWPDQIDDPDPANEPTFADMIELD